MKPKPCPCKIHRFVRNLWYEGGPVLVVCGFAAVFVFIGYRCGWKTGRIAGINEEVVREQHESVPLWRYGWVPSCETRLLTITDYGNYSETICADRAHGHTWSEAPKPTPTPKAFMRFIVGSTTYLCPEKP